MEHSGKNTRIYLKKLLIVTLTTKIASNSVNQKVFPKERSLITLTYNNVTQITYFISNAYAALKWFKK
jgi:hypothetical protein